MHVALLRLFQRQIKFQCDCVLIAAQELDKALAHKDFTAFFCAIQSLLGSAANISKALWSVRKTKNALAARAPLRASLQITDASPLNPRNMRDNYEHFDERLDKWWEQSKNHNFMDMGLMARKAIQGFAEIERFRAYDPATGDLTFWGDDLSLLTLVDEIRHIYPIVTVEAEQPHR
jgi:hypothetical protein